MKQFAVVDPATGKATAFYRDDFHKVIPEEAVEITEEQHQALLEAAPVETPLAASVARVASALEGPRGGGAPVDTDELIDALDEFLNVMGGRGGVNNCPKLEALIARRKG